jgi:serine/threonine protein kinase
MGKSDSLRDAAMAKAPSSQTSGSGPGDDDSVTAIGERGLLRDRAPEIERGFVLAGRYQVEAVIGKGGSGVVLRAFDRTAQMPVAVKVLKSDLAKDERWSKRFARELRLGRPIRHPNVCRIFDISEADGHKFLTMELAGGGTLRDLIKKGGTLRPLEERIADAAAVIGGLAAIHEAGIVHRDVKPDNVLRMEDGRLALSDFGLATDLSNSQMVTVMVGTPHYMAPEIRAGEPATTRSDVWSLGVVLHEIFFGRRPERKSSLSMEGTSRPPAPLTSSIIERAMLALCEVCLSENPFDRPSDALATLRLFEKARSGSTLFRKWSSGKRAALVASAVAAAAGIWVVVKPDRSSHRKDGVIAVPAVPRIEPSGDPIDWTPRATIVAASAGAVDCFSMVNDTTARLVWRSPRRAEDVDILTGARTKASLVPEAFAVGCPESSPQGDALLFTSKNTAGISFVYLSRSPDGRGAVPITPGDEPMWLKGGEEFVYGVDSAHVAVFSLATMTFSLVGDGGQSGRQMVSQKAVSPRGDAIALLLADERGQWSVVIFHGAGFTLRSAFSIPAARRIRFTNDSEKLLVSFQLARAMSTLTVLDWPRGTAKHVGTYPGFDLIDAGASSLGTTLLARRVLSDVWLHEGGQKRRLTSDGQNFSAAVSIDGDLLLGRLTSSGQYTIWLKRKGEGAAREMTRGPLDVEPEFSPDGTTWAYVDYENKRIVACPTAGGACSPLVSDELLPGRPRFSSDGKRLAYVTQMGSPRLFTVSVVDRIVRPVGTVRRECPPVWSSSETIWSYEGTSGEEFWTERNVLSGARTGRRVEVDRSSTALCLPKDVRADSELKPRLRVEQEELSRLLLLRGGLGP